MNRKTVCVNVQKLDVKPDQELIYKNECIYSKDTTRVRRNKNIVDNCSDQYVVYNGYIYKKVVSSKQLVAETTINNNSTLIPKSNFVKHDPCTSGLKASLPKSCVHKFNGDSVSNKTLGNKLVQGMTTRQAVKCKVEDFSYHGHVFYRCYVLLEDCNKAVYNDSAFAPGNKRCNPRVKNMETLFNCQNCKRKHEELIKERNNGCTFSSSCLSENKYKVRLRSSYKPLAEKTRKKCFSPSKYVKMSNMSKENFLSMFCLKPNNKPRRFVL